MAQIVRLPLTPAGRDLIRECHSITSIWAEPPPGNCDISEVDWDDMAIEIEKLFASGYGSELRGQS